MVDASVLREQLAAKQKELDEVFAMNKMFIDKLRSKHLGEMERMTKQLEEKDRQMKQRDEEAKKYIELLHERYKEQLQEMENKAKANDKIAKEYIEFYKESVEKRFEQNKDKVVTDYDGIIQQKETEIMRLKGLLFKKDMELQSNAEAAEDCIALLKHRLLNKRNSNSTATNDLKDDESAK